MSILDLEKQEEIMFKLKELKEKNFLVSDDFIEDEIDHLDPQDWTEVFEEDQLSFENCR